MKKWQKMCGIVTFGLIDIIFYCYKTVFGTSGESIRYKKREMSSKTLIFTCQ